MTVIVNGAAHEVRDQATVAEAVALVTGVAEPLGVAVARNGELVLRSAWESTLLQKDDRIEVLHAVQGG